MALKFLNKKGWHTGSLRNIETVWKAEQKHEAEEKKLDELRKQIQEEREKNEFRQLQEQAGLVPRQERLEFLYDSGLSVGKPHSESFPIGKPPDATKPEEAAQSSKDPLASLPGALFSEDKSHSSNDTWRKLHSDPLLMIRQREQEALAKIKNNPVKMEMIRKSLKEHNGDKKDKRSERKKHHKKEKKKKRYDSDTDSSSDSDTRRRNKGKKGKHHFDASSSDNEIQDTKRSVAANDKPRIRDGAEVKVRSRAMSPDRHLKRHRSRSSSPRTDKRRSRSPERRTKRYRSRSPSLQTDKLRPVSPDRHSKRYRSKSPSEKPRQRCRSPSKKANKLPPRPYEGRHKSTSNRDSWPKKENPSNHRDTLTNHRDEPPHARDGRDKTFRLDNRHKYQAGRLSEEEKAARLREMQMDAEVHEEQRWQRLKRASEADANEAREAARGVGKNFLDATNKSVYGAEKGGSSTIEESIRRRAHFSQGSTSAEGNAFRR